jgi:hypothetical protein
MELEGLLSCSQHPATGPYPETDKSSPRPSVLHGRKMCSIFGLPGVPPSWTTNTGYSKKMYKHYNTEY